MGYNAGGYGSMTFPSEAALAAWRAKATVSHARWKDWGSELESSAYEPDEIVAERLKRVVKGHDPKSFSIQVVTIVGATVSLVYDDGEDGFRDHAGDLAALVRSADTHGAKGAFYFLGTAGAEGDFATEVRLDGETSTVRDLPRAEVRAAYGEAYRSYQDRVLEILEAGDPRMKAMMDAFREGEKPSAASEPFHQRVMAALANVSDAALTASAKKFPATVPSGKGIAMAKDVFKRDVRAMFSRPANEETRGVALFVLGLHQPRTAVAIAREILDSNKPSAPMQLAALRALGSARGEPWVVPYLVDTFVKAESILHLSAGQQAVLAIDKATAIAIIEAALAKITKNPKQAVLSPGAFLAGVAKRRKLVELVPALERYAAGKRGDLPGRRQAGEVVKALRSRKRSAAKKGAAKKGVKKPAKKSKRN